jgi:hypothetical protein
MKSVGAWRFRDLVTDRLPADGLDDERKRRALPLCMEMTIGRSCVSAAHRSGGARDKLNAARQRRRRADPRGAAGSGRRLAAASSRIGRCQRHVQRETRA